MRYTCAEDGDELHAHQLSLWLASDADRRRERAEDDGVALPGLLLTLPFEEAAVISDATRNRRSGVSDARPLGVSP